MKRFLKRMVSLLVVVLLTATSSGAALAAPSNDSSKKTEVAVPVQEPAQNIKVSLHHVLLESGSGNSVRVREVLKIKSTSKESLKLSLPKGYTNLQVTGTSGSVVKNPDGFTTSFPVSIGESQLSFTYDLLFNGDAVVFSKVINYPTDVVYVLSPKDQLKITGDDAIEDYGLQTLEGNVYHVLLLNQPSPGQAFKITIDPDRLTQGYQEPKSGFHSASHLQNWYSSPLKNTNPHYWVAGAAVLFFGILTAASHVIRKNHKNQKAKEQQEHLDGLLDQLVMRQKRLLDKVDALELKKENDQINEEDYAALRKQYIDKMIKIKLKIRELEAREDAGE